MRHRAISQMAISAIGCVLAVWPASGCRADRPPSVRYEFKEDLNRPIRWTKGDQFMDGKFDAAGNFIPSTLPKKSPSASEPNRHYSNRPRAKDRTTLAERETVFEFRSGFLVLGILEKTGEFVPKVGEKIIAMKNYQYTSDAPRIYNLPGVLLRIENGKLAGSVDPAP